MVKKFMVHARWTLKLAVMLTFMSKCFVVPFPTMKAANFLSFKNTCYKNMVKVDKTLLSMFMKVVCTDGSHSDWRKLKATGVTSLFSVMNCFEQKVRDSNLHRANWNWKLEQE